MLIQSHGIIKSIKNFIAITIIDREQTFHYNNLKQKETNQGGAFQNSLLSIPISWKLRLNNNLKIMHGQ